MHLRTDFGGAFANHVLEKYTAKEEVKWESWGPYTPKQNGKAKCFNYIMISLVQSNLAAIHLFRILSNEQIKTVVYLKNWSSAIKNITFYKLGNYTRPDFSYLKVIGFRGWVQIPNGKRVKLDIFFNQRIIIGYEYTNQYSVYNLRNEKIHITRDLFMDEQHLYHQEAINNWDHLENAWVEGGDT